VGGKQTAYICEDYSCQLPTSDIESMMQILETINQKKVLV